MRYKSTRNSQLRLEASQVIAQGISEEGGLFVPETLPDLREELPALAKLEYPALAKTIFRKFLTDFTPEEVGYCVDLSLIHICFPQRLARGDRSVVLCRCARRRAVRCRMTGMNV